MTSRWPGENVPLREDHSRTDNSTESLEGSSSTSITPGPGALTAKFLKWVGNNTLDAIQEMVIRRRLAVIKQVVRNKPHVFIAPLSSQDVREANRAYEDLQELCRGNYPLSIQRKSARIILEIAFYTSNASSDIVPRALTGRGIFLDQWNRWSALLRISSASLNQKSMVRADSALISSAEAALSSMATTATGYTTDTRNTSKSWSSSRTWTSVRLARAKAVARVGIPAKLSSIKRTVRKKPYIFTSSQGPHQMQEVDSIFGDLAYLTRPHHSLRTRQKAARLVLEIAVMISGTDEIMSLETPFDDDGVSTISPQLWGELVTRSDVQTLLMPGR